MVGGKGGGRSVVDENEEDFEGEEDVEEDEGEFWFWSGDVWFALSGLL